MSNDIQINYGDVLKAYQTKSTELLTQLMTAEAKVIASANVIMELRDRISKLEEKNKEIGGDLNPDNEALDGNAIDTVGEYN